MAVAGAFDKTKFVPDHFLRTPPGISPGWPRRGALRPKRKPRKPGAHLQPRKLRWVARGRPRPVGHVRVRFPALEYGDRHRGMRDVRPGASRPRRAACWPHLRLNPASNQAPRKGTSSLSCTPASRTALDKPVRRFRSGHGPLAKTAAGAHLGGILHQAPPCRRLDQPRSVAVNHAGL